MAEKKRSIVPLERRLIKHDFKTLESALSVNFASSYFSEDCSVYASELEDESASQPSDLVLLAEAVDNDHIRTSVAPAQADHGADGLSVPPKHSTAVVREIIHPAKCIIKRSRTGERRDVASVTASPLKIPSDSERIVPWKSKQGNSGRGSALHKAQGCIISKRKRRSGGMYQSASQPTSKKQEAQLLKAAIAASLRDQESLSSMVPTGFAAMSKQAC